MATYTKAEPRVFIAFGEVWPGAAVGNFTNISTYVTSISTKWGRTNWLDEYRAATCTITLIDTDRRFDPLYSSGTYYPDITPGCPIWIDFDYTVGAASGTKDIFAGMIDKWEVTSPTSDAYGHVTITATDMLAVLARHPVTGSVSAGNGSTQIQDVLDLDSGWWTSLSGAFGWSGAGRSTLQAFTAAGESTLEWLQLIARSEGGSFYAKPLSGANLLSRLYFTERFHDYAASPADSIISDDDTEGRTCRSVTFDYGNLNIYNRASITRVGGAEQKDHDQTSIDKYGDRPIEYTGLLLATDSEADSYAEWLVDRYKHPLNWVGRIECQWGVGIDPGDVITDNQTLLAPVLINTPVRINRHPQGGTLRQINAIIEGGRFDYQVGRPIRTVWNARPFRLDEYWLLGKTGRSELGQSTRLGW